MSVRLAAQVLSKTVADVLKHFGPHFGTKGTAQFCIKNIFVEHTLKKF